MCGLVGVFTSNLDSKLKGTFYDLLVIDTLRGHHSTGVFVAGKDAQGDWDTLAKEVGTPDKLYASHGVGYKKREFSTRNGNYLLMGHNRWATKGAINAENAHPFDMGQIVGAHNGSVSLWDLRKFHGHGEYEVDSQIIYSHLNHLGGDIKALWKELDGPAALTWFNRADKTLNICRNKERTLFYAYTKDHKALVYASEEVFIWAAALRNGLELDTETGIKPFEVNIHYTVNKNSEGVVTISEEVMDPFVRPPFRSTVTYYRGNSFNAREKEDQEFWDNWDYAYGGYSPASSHSSGNGDKAGETKQGSKEANKASSARDKTSSETTGPAPKNFIIKSVVQNKDGSLNHGIAVDPSGRTVRVLFGPELTEDTTKRILGRGTLGGYYTSKEVKTSALFKYTAGVQQFFVDYQECQYMALKDGFTVEFSDDDIWEISCASDIPWVGGSKFHTRKQWELFTECGCDNCMRAPTFEENKELLWIDSKTFLCNDCKDINNLLKVNG